MKSWSFTVVWFYCVSLSYSGIAERVQSNFVQQTLSEEELKVCIINSASMWVYMVCTFVSIEICDRAVSGSEGRGNGLHQQNMLHDVV